MTDEKRKPTDRLHGLKKVKPAPHPSAVGATTGVNFEPGNDDDGWIVPQPVDLGDGNTVQLYKDGEAWAAAVTAMRRAKFRICLELYIFASDASGRAVASLLCERARQGVQVFVLYDSFGSLYSDRSLFEDMRHAGVHVQEFSPMRPWECRFSYRPVNRDHRKLLIIDDNIAGLGGMNLGEEYAGSWIVKSKLASANLRETEQWRDNAVSIYGPAVHEFVEAFHRTWQYVHSGGPVRRAGLIRNLYSGNIGVLASVPTVDSPLQPLLCRLLQDANKSISLTMAYFAPGDTLIDELCKAARRGARVRLMLPGRGDIALLVVAARSFYQRLMECGVEIYERQQVVLHAKTIVVDEAISVIGSANLDYRSIEFNCELSAVIRNTKFGQQLEAMFDHDKKFALRIDPAQWKQRPFFDRATQWIVSHLRQLL